MMFVVHLLRGREPARMKQEMSVDIGVAIRQMTLTSCANMIVRVRPEPPEPFKRKIFQADHFEDAIHQASALSSPGAVGSHPCRSACRRGISGHFSHFP